MTDEEKTKVRRCLDLLAQAQSLIDLARGELIELRGFCQEWGALSRDYDLMKTRRKLISERQQKLLHAERNRAQRS